VDVYNVYVIMVASFYLSWWLNTYLYNQ